jgi:predicted DNA-binding transcriptional regulator AlpA
VSQKAVEGPEQDYLNLGEVCAYLRVGETTLRRLIAAGRFPEGQRQGGVGDRVWHWLTVVAFAHLSALLPEWQTPPPRRARPSRRDESS